MPLFTSSDLGLLLVLRIWSCLHLWKTTESLYLCALFACIQTSANSFHNIIGPFLEFNTVQFIIRSLVFFHPTILMKHDHRHPPCYAILQHSEHIPATNHAAMYMTQGKSSFVRIFQFPNFSVQFLLLFFWFLFPALLVRQ